jgi:hypothetical protein
VKTAQWGIAGEGDDLPLAVDVHRAHGDAARRVVAQQIQRAWSSKSITRSKCANDVGTRLVESNRRRSAISSAHAPNRDTARRRDKMHWPLEPEEKAAAQ